MISSCSAERPAVTATISSLERVVPFAAGAAPDGVTVLRANNNLDVARHEGRVFLAWRTAPTHYASADAVINVVSTQDDVTWRFEARFSEGTDVREPRLLSWNGALFLYYAVLGSNPLRFEPQGMKVAERRGADWTTSEWFHSRDFIPWRTKIERGRPYMVAYEGGKNIYEVNGDPIRIHWLTTDDGRAWRAAVPGQPVVSTGGGSEADFALLDNGGLVAVIRNEEGDDFGWGSKICRAEAESLGTWRCVADARKFDSPLVFRSGGEVFLIARRNVSPDGRYDLGESESRPRAERSVVYQVDYWLRPKRCALWRVDAALLRVDFVADLPSKGDTCFAAVDAKQSGEVVVYNYSSPLDGPDVSWQEGQYGVTYIYRMLLRISAAF